jgi:polysaccharide deacetylase family protein (PEP-CTERM system associated)
MDMTAELLLSFHVEEHFHAPAFDSPMRRRHWDQCESRVEKNIAKLLDVLAERSVTATFFVLGWIAERHRGLIRRIARGGHEIASHGYAHEIVTAQTTSQFREDIRKTKQILEDLTGQAVLGYRAPGCSLTAETYWALPIIVDEGYKYDSSLCRLPEKSVRYEQCSRLDFTGGSLWEIPLYSLKVARVALPADGFSMRLLPYRLLKRALRSAKANHESVLVHLRVWEVDPGQPRMKGHPLALFKQYYNLSKAEDRLRRLLRDFRFAPLREAIRSEEVTRSTTLAMSQVAPTGIQITTMP